MALQSRGEHRYGDDLADLHQELARYARVNEAPAEHFADAVCHCGGRAFRLRLDEAVGLASRTCVACGREQFLGDAAEDRAEAELVDCACPCGGERLEVAVAAAVHADGEDARWLYVGARCSACGLVACFGDWKCDGGPYESALSWMD